MIENKIEVKVRQNNNKNIVAAYNVKNLNVALYLSKIYSTIYSVEIIYGNKRWLI